MGFDADIEVGSTGQFDVLVDGKVVASRSRGFLSRLLGGGWPDPGAVVKAIRSRTQSPI